MDPSIVKLRNNLKTFTLKELKKEVIRTKKVNFAVTRMKRFHVVQLIVDNYSVFPHLLNKTGTKRQPKQEIIPPASIKLPPELLNKLAKIAITKITSILPN